MTTQPAAIYLSAPPLSRPAMALAAQEHYLRAYAAAHRLSVAAIYKEAPGDSGRQALARLMRSAARGLFSYLLVIGADTLAQDAFALSICLERLRGLRVRVLPAVPLPGEAARALHMGFLQTLAPHYAAQTGAEALRRLANMPDARSAVNRTLPLGFTTQNGRPAPNPAIAPFVQEAFAAVVNGASPAAARKALAAKLAPHGGLPRGFCMEDMLRNEACAGTLDFAALRIPNAFPAFVRQALFDKAQEQLNAARPPAPPCFLLEHKAYCDCCAAPMRGVSYIDENGSPAFAYVCAQPSGRRACAASVTEQAALEAYVAERTCRLLQNETTIARAADLVAEMHEAAFGQAALARQAHIVQTLARGERPETPFAVRPEHARTPNYSRRRALEEAELLLIGLRAAEPCTREAIRAWIRSLTSAYDGTETRRRQIIDIFVRAVWVNGSRVSIALPFALPNSKNGTEAVCLPKPPSWYTIIENPEPAEQA